MTTCEYPIGCTNTPTTTVTTQPAGDGPPALAYTGIEVGEMAAAGGGAILAGALLLAVAYGHIPRWLRRR